jgi:Ca2+-binding EF-hand superfamily protein
MSNEELDQLMKDIDLNEEGKFDYVKFVNNMIS